MPPLRLPLPLPLPLPLTRVGGGNISYEEFVAWWAQDGCAMPNTNPNPSPNPSPSPSPKPNPYPYPNPNPNPTPKQDGCEMLDALATAAVEPLP